MKGQKLKILFKENKAFLTPDKALTFEQIGLHDFANKNFKSAAYWIFEVIDFIENENKIIGQLLWYHTGETNFDESQIQLFDKLNQIEFLKFRSIDTNGLLKTMAGKNLHAIRHKDYVPTKEAIQIPESETSVQIETVESEEMNQISNFLPAETGEQTLVRKFIVPIKKLRFIFGGVSFDKKLDVYKEPIEFTIVNYDIREEFDAIKNYFSNVLKTKNIEVTAELKFNNQDLVDAIADSPEINKINKDLIDNVKFEFIKSTKRKIDIDINKNLFTMDEYFDHYGEHGFNSNSLFGDDKDFFESILGISNTKHYIHLRYLSNNHAHNVMKLRFVHKPFSFIFLIAGERNYHLIWETLDTEEATYVWRVEKNIKQLKLKTQKLEDIINTIKVQGKTAYINIPDESFRRIYHDYSNLVEGFVKWKGELESMLT